MRKEFLTRHAFCVKDGSSDGSCCRAEEIYQRGVGKCAEPGEESEAIEPRPDGIYALWDWVADVLSEFDCI